MSLKANAVRGIFEQIEVLGSNVFEKIGRDMDKGLEKFKKEEGLCFNMPVIYAFGERVSGS